MRLQIVNFTQNKLGLKTFQDFFTYFGPSLRELSVVIKGIMNRYIIDI